MRKKFHFFLTCFALCALLTNTSCGWQVRGHDYPTGDAIKLWLESEDTQHILLQELIQALEKSGLIISKRKQDADYVVVIIEHRNNRKIGTYNSGFRAAEYRLLEEVDFVVHNLEGFPVGAPSTASIERAFNFIEQDVMASSYEERSLKSRMKLEIARQIIVYLRTIHGKSGK